MSSTEEYQQQQFFDHNVFISLEINMEEFKKQQALMFKDLITFGGCAYHYPSLKHVSYREFLDKIETDGTVGD